MERAIRLFCIILPPSLFLWAITILIVAWGKISVLEEKVSFLEGVELGQYKVEVQDAKGRT